MTDRSASVAQFISEHSRFKHAGKGRLGLTRGAWRMAQTCRIKWPDLTMAEFERGLSIAAQIVTEDEGPIGRGLVGRV